MWVCFSPDTSPVTFGQDFALAVEQITTKPQAETRTRCLQVPTCPTHPTHPTHLTSLGTRALRKRANLILNVDGCIAVRQYHCDVELSGRALFEMSDESYVFHSCGSHMFGPLGKSDNIRACEACFTDMLRSCGAFSREEALFGSWFVFSCESPHSEVFAFSVHFGAGRRFDELWMPQRSLRFGPFNGLHRSPSRSTEATGRESSRTD